MSQYVFLRAADLPSRSAWQSKLDETSSGLVLGEINPGAQAGYVPATLAGVNCGFELYSRDVTDLSEVELGHVGERDLCLEFVTHSDLMELKAAQIAAAAVAVLADGIFFDGIAYRRIDNVLTLMRETEAEELAWKRQRAEKDAAISTDRCPNCGAPCPAYRKTCKACGKAVGG